MSNTITTGVSAPKQVNDLLLDFYFEQSSMAKEIYDLRDSLYLISAYLSAGDLSPEDEYLAGCAKRCFEQAKALRRNMVNWMFNCGISEDQIKPNHRQPEPPEFEIEEDYDPFLAEKTAAAKII